jgi:hypothetical protein
MPNFWENLLRFPRFFISSTLGLILTIIGPFLNLLKTPKTTLLFLVLVLSFAFFIIYTLEQMIF